MSNQTTGQTQSQTSGMWLVFWSLFWRAMVFFPVVLIGFALAAASFAGLLWLVTWAIVCAVFHQWFSSALCLGGVLVFAAAAWWIWRRSGRSTTRHHGDDAGGKGVLL
jgi:hypothetical protein